MLALEKQQIKRWCGWARLQVSQALISRVHDSYMLQDVMGSDHCPLGLVIKAG